jgi:GNAT superfamily N-acetyltransferase
MATWGIGSHLMSALIGSARQRGIARIEGEILTNNNMIKLTQNLGFSYIHAGITVA